MKKLLLILLATILIFSCKNKSKTTTTKAIIDDTTLSTEPLSKEKRPEGYAEQQDQRAGRKKPPTTVGPSSKIPVIFLDFNGGTIINTTWNLYSSVINATPSNLVEADKQAVRDSLKNDFKDWNVVWIDNIDSFNASTAIKQRVIFTQEYSWYGATSAGVAFRGSFTDGSGNPCFVFTSLLGYSVKKIFENGSHELGHTLGLLHHSVYDGTTYVSEYSYGPTPAEGWAPIMGCSYYQPNGIFNTGISAAGTMQDDVALISKYLPLK